jgi:hypothetical protein
VALSAAIIGNSGKASCAAVLHVARTAGGNERLALIVGRSFVTSETCAVRDGCSKTGVADVTQIATIAENGVRWGHRSAAVDALMSEDSRVKKPAESQQRHPDRKPHPPAPKGMKLGEILQVDPLG